MQKGLRQDAPLLRFFGLAGTEKVADICFLENRPASPKNARSVSVSHGGFDNDIPTMTSVVRRVLDVSDATAVVDYFEDAVPGFEHPAVGIPPSSIARGGRHRAPADRSEPGNKAARQRPRQRARRRASVESRSLSLHGAVVPLPLTQAQTRRATRWLMTQFGDDLRRAVDGTPFGVELLCGIACKETGSMWLPFVDRGMPPAEILGRAVGDASGDFPNTSRRPFPRTLPTFRRRLATRSPTC